MKELAARALNLAQVRGASYADVRIVTRLTQRLNGQERQGGSAGSG